MNLERVDADRSEELNLPVGSILLSQMEYIIGVLITVRAESPVEGTDYSR